MNALYTAEALSASDKTFNVTLASPPELGSLSGSINPKQLLAAGFAACFRSALHAVARGKKINFENSTIGGRMEIGNNDVGGFKLAVELEITNPDLPYEQAQELADAAHLVCPYSSATRGNIDVIVLVSND